MSDIRKRANDLLADIRFLFNVTPLGIPLSEFEVLPYKSFQEIADFLWTVAEDRLPKWINLTESLKQTSSYCCEQKEILKVPRAYLKKTTVPKTLVCHDYKGGYLDDRFINTDFYKGVDFYPFTQWSQIDSFVYFSHNLVTVPPLCWINEGHTHAVSVLGTLITEGKEGKLICDRVLESELHWRWFADALVLINEVHGFDGYLVNIENPLSDVQVTELIKFLRYLKKKLPKSSLTIWYDSVTRKGDLHWQNALNSRNIDFFNACDGIYLNYAYQKWQLEKSGQLAGRRKHDVYVGIDVFGRGCPGSGFFCSEAAAMARSCNLSIAIFAPGWVREVVPGDPVRNDRIFWSALDQYLYTHGAGGKAASQYVICGNQTDNGIGDTNPYKPRRLIPLLIPTTNSELQHRVLLDFQEAVVTFRDRNVDKFYDQLPLSLMEPLRHSEGPILAINTDGQVDTLEIPFMFFDITLTKGISMILESMLTKNVKNASPMPELFVIVDELGEGVSSTYTSTMSLDHEWSTSVIRLETKGILLEVGIRAPPNYGMSIRNVEVNPL